MTVARTVRLPDGRLLSYTLSGDPGGVPILEFHGPGGPGPSFVDERPLQRLGVRLLTVHRPGYAGSSPAPGSGPLEFADDVASLLDGLGIARAALHAVTGSTPWGLACAAKLAPRIHRLALSSVIGPPDVPDLRAAIAPQFAALLALAQQEPAALRTRFVEMRRMLEQARARQRVAADWGAVLRGAAEQRQLADARIQAAVASAILDHGDAFLDGVERDFAVMAEPWPFSLDSIGVPVGIWHGSADSDVGLAHPLHLRAKLPNARLTIWHDEGHYAYFERAPEILAWLMDEPA